MELAPLESVGMLDSERTPLESVGIVEPLESGKNKSQMHSANLHHLASVQLRRCSPQYFSSRSSNWQLTEPLLEQLNVYSF